MSVLDRYKQRSAYKKSTDTPLSPNVFPPSPVVQSSPLDSSVQFDEIASVPQLAFPDNPISSISADGLATSMAPEAPTALITRDTPNEQVALSAQNGARALREPTRIRGTGKKSSGTMLAPKVSGKRTRTNVIVLALTFLVVLGVLATVVPLTPDSDALGGRSLLGTLMHWSEGKKGNTALIASQIATATAVMQDGYDAGPGVTYAGIPGPPSSGSPNLNRFFYGQCTYYANMEYGAITGHYVPWLGNANQWVYGARAAGWQVSSTPSVPAIIAFDSYVDGAGAYGHVGVTTSVNGNQVTYGSWNTYGAPFATTTYATVIAPAPGVWFLRYPGA